MKYNKLLSILMKLQRYVISIQVLSNSCIKCQHTNIYRLFFFQTTNGNESGRVSLDQFHLLRVIGRGSYAKVLMVEQKTTARVYAMKVIKKELVNDDEVGKFLAIK